VGAEAVSESVTATEQALEGRGSGAWGVDGAGPVTAAAVGAGAAWGSGEAARLAPEVASLVHAQLVAAAERCYPTPARRFRQRGTVEVRFCLDEQGRVGDAQLQRSSGSDVLDAAVGACVLPKAAPFPEAARGRCFAVPVRFGVRR
jgi:TonB family protein